MVRDSSYPQQTRNDARDQLNLLDALEAEQLTQQGDYEHALAILNKLKRTFGERIFPFQDQVAHTHLESGDIEAAKEAFEVIATNPGYPKDQQEKARAEIEELEVTELLDKGYAALDGRLNWTRVRQIDALLSQRHGSHPDAIAFHATILSLSGKM